jgi:two-component system nitrogen regulation sensor histidine kinase GlnL
MNHNTLRNLISTEDVFATLPDGVALVDEKLTLLEVNPAMEALAGRSRARLVGQPLKSLFPEDDRLPAMVERCLATGRSANDFDRPLTLPGRPSTSVWVTTTPVFDDKGAPAGALLIVRDFGNLHAFQEQMRRADRLSSMGVLAAGLAHEIRNPLGGIKGAAQLLAGESHSSHEYSEVIVREVERIDALLGKLLDLARPTDPSLDRLNIHQLLDDILTLQSETAAAREITVEKNYDPSIPPIEADPAQLTQVILNLVKNAHEATPSGGTIQVTTRMATDFALPAPGPGGRTIPVVCIEVADTGPGIPPGLEDRLFTPFFTTKTEGAGLGLSVANSIVERHGGRLELTNDPGGGAVARCYLPIEHPQQMREAP